MSLIGLQKKILAFHLSFCSVSSCPALLLQTIAETFCKAIGLIWRTSEVTLRTTADKDHGHRSWQVRFLFYENRNSGELSRGWRRFCTDNRIKEGDICTFNVIETTLWHVDITRHGEDQGTISNELEQSDKTRKFPKLCNRN